jgi:2,3-bisphosphoglycerate-dependent phosphoglycerate mutase
MESIFVLVRHGESQWNHENRFTGWTDVPLSTKGIAEAHAAGMLLRETKTCFDFAYTSVLNRAIRTLWIILDEMDMMWMPVECTWRLNERHYGALQGLNKDETALEYSPDLVYQWRRSYTSRPPALKNDDPRHPRFDPRYSHIPHTNLPATESLEDTLKRVLPLWEKEIYPQLQSRKNILIVAHGNSLRALIKHIERISDESIPDLNIPTGIPLFYEYSKDKGLIKKPIKARISNPGNHEYGIPKDLTNNTDNYDK